MELAIIPENPLGMRVESCLAVINDVSQLLLDKGLHPHIVEQLQRLDELLSIIDHQAVTESDLDRIEGATNQLLSELGVLFVHQRLGCLYHQACH